MQEKCYVIREWKGERPRIAGKVFNPEQEPFCTLEYAKIDNYIWDPEGYCPEARAYVAYTEEGLLALLCAKEKETFAEETRIGGDVYLDSCLEFFLMGRPSCNKNYINFEVNVNGVPHIGVGTDRYDRSVMQTIPDGMQIESSRHEGEWWAVCYNIPYSLIRDCLGGDPEKEMRANFYKCGQKIQQHAGSWSPVHYEIRDFHRSDRFGLLKLGE